MCLLDELRKDINDIDLKMMELFLERMGKVETIYRYKKENNLTIFDGAREEYIIKSNSGKISDDKLRDYYVDFLKAIIRISRQYQEDLNLS